MDPITLAIIGALSKVGGEAFTDAYHALKNLIKAKYGAKSELIKSVESLEKKPESPSRKETLHEEVVSAKADKDEKILKVANEILTKINNGQVNVSQTVTGNDNVFTGTGDITIHKG
jgi:hypothetical protein